MYLKEIKLCTNTCSGINRIAKIYFEDKGKTFYWDEISPEKIRKSPGGEVTPEDLKKITEVLLKEKARRRFTRDAKLISKALKSLIGKKL
ncbi:MAG TPA: hypothetical protein ENH28_06795 [Euryarchaeota archaeon]|nr:hypothetical protein BMS3Bbin15_01762 [archaeon BMS3Bbin15]HDL15838.1 hypothetical protein [Euryarchaeota archaeon]